MFERVYLEITNVCNRACSFCPGCAREKRFMSLEEFRTYTGLLRAYTDCLCFHVMGEPTLHPELDRFLARTDELNYRVILTTNGTLLQEKGELLLSHRSLYKVHISLHGFEEDAPKGENLGGIQCIGAPAEDETAVGALSGKAGKKPDGMPVLAPVVQGKAHRIFGEKGQTDGEKHKTPEGDCFGHCFDFAARASGQGVIVILRLWNMDGREKADNSLNDEIMKRLRGYFGGEWRENKRGYLLRKKLYLEFDRRFVWPASGGKILRQGGRCHALSRQIAVLCDGTVVPCCLDGQGVIRLGNLKEQPLEEILNSPLAQRMRERFSRGGAYAHPLCTSCGYADRFAGRFRQRKT